MGLKSILKKCLIAFFSLFFRLIDLILTRKNTILIWRYGSAIGDQVMISAVVNELYKTQKIKAYILCSCPELFAHNPKILNTFNFKKIPTILRASLISALSKKYKSIHEFTPELHNGDLLPDYMQANPDENQKHLIQLHSQHWPYTLTYEKPAVEIFITPEECKDVHTKFGLIPRTYCLLHSEGKQSFTPNKDWGYENFQQIIDLSKDDIQWLQVGMPSDAALNDAIDLRGKTNLRELAALIQSSSLILCTEGLYTHMASAVGTRSVTIYSGFLNANASTYHDTIAIQKRGVECAPCWLQTPCPYDKFCITSITPDDVIVKVRGALNMKESKAV